MMKPQTPIHKNLSRMLLPLLAVFLLSFAPGVFAQSAYNWGVWTPGAQTTQPKWIWNGGGSYSANAPTIKSASWTNGYHSASITTTQPDGFSMIVNPDTIWGGSDDGPQPPNGLYGDTTALLGLSPNVVVQSITIQGGISSDMVVGFYDVIPSYIKVAAFDRFGAPVSFAGVNPAFRNCTDYAANNPLTLNADGTFSGALTPIPGGTIDTCFTGFTGFNPSITRLDIVSTRPAQSGGQTRWGDGYSVYLGSNSPITSVPTLGEWGRLILTLLFIGFAGWMWRRQAH